MREVGVLGGAIYLSLLVLRHTAWSTLKLLSHRARSQPDCTRSMQIPLLVNFAELLVVFVLKRVHFAILRGHFVAAAEIFEHSKNFNTKIDLHTFLSTTYTLLVDFAFYWLTSRSTGSLRVLLVYFVLTSSSNFQHD